LATFTDTHTPDTSTPKVAPAQNPRQRFKQRLLRVDACDSLPLTLKHERIYILPTGRGLAFVVVAMVMILASMNYGLNLGYALSFILVGLFASCLLSTYLNLAGLTIDSIQSEDTFAGTPLEYAITLTGNRAKSRYSITLAAGGATDVIDVNHKQSSTAMLRIKTEQRGEHRLGRITISSDFPLGLWRGWGYLHAPSGSYVYPAPEKPVPAFPAGYSENQKANAKAPGEREFQQLKRYQESDPLSAVAWKTVARGGGWYSKEFSEGRVANDLQLSWSATATVPDNEHRLSRLSAWVLRADAMAIPYSLELTGHHSRAQLGAEHKRSCLRQLAMIGTRRS
jgi:uncharacterized protein (DUF58 family)